MHCVTITVLRFFFQDCLITDRTWNKLSQLPKLDCEPTTYHEPQHWNFILFLILFSIIKKHLNSELVRV